MEGKFFEAKLYVNNSKTPGLENFSSEFYLFKEVLMERMFMLFSYSRNFPGL